MRKDRSVAHGSTGGAGGGSELGYEFRCGGVFHPRASEDCDRFVATFKETIETKAVELAKREKSEDVQPSHVERVYSSIGPSSRRWRFWREVSKYTLGVAVTTAFGVIVGQAGVEVDTKTAFWLIAICLVVALVAAPFAFREFID